MSSSNQSELERTGASVVPVPLRARRRCGDCPLRARCLPAGLNADETLRFEGVVQRTRTLTAGEHLYRVGDGFHALFGVRSGCLKTYAVDAEGREHVTNFAFPGELMGADAIYPEMHGANAVALVDSAVCYLPFRAVTQLAQEMPELQSQLLRLLSRDVFGMASMAGDYTAEERLAAFLVMVAARQPAGTRGENHLLLPMSRQDIANYLRLATETVSRILARFQRSGLVRADRRHIELRNPAGLHEIAECMNPFARCQPQRRRAAAGAPD